MSRCHILFSLELTHILRNAGFFIWIDLSPYLGSPTEEKDGWILEKELNERLAKAGVLLASGGPYHSEKAGWFRLVFSWEREYLEEGLRRYAYQILGLGGSN